MPYASLNMENDVVEAAVKGVMPAQNGAAIFLGPEDKTFVIYVDQTIGNALSIALEKVRKDRPLTHELLYNVLVGLDAEVQRIVINDVNDSTFYARIIIRMENEIDTKLVEIDARPSDSIVLAIHAKKPIYVARKVLDQVEDMTELLERILKQQESE